MILEGFFDESEKNKEDVKKWLERKSPDDMLILMEYSNKFDDFFS